jgi:hypothetical protein
LPVNILMINTMEALVVKPGANSNRVSCRRATLLVCATALLLSGGFTKPVVAQPNANIPADKSAKPLSGGTPSTAERQLDLDRDRLEFEKRKFAVETNEENDKLENEKVKTRWSAISTIVPIIAALLTLGYGIWSFRKQAIEAAKLQNEGAKLQFEIKAAEIAFDGKTPKAVENRGRVLKRIFNNRLPESFPAPFEAGEHGGGKEAPAEKITFLELLLKYPDKEQQILKLWTALFGDPWIERIRPLVAGCVGADPKGSGPDGSGLPLVTPECVIGTSNAIKDETLDPPAANGAAARYEPGTGENGLPGQDPLGS